MRPRTLLLAGVGFAVLAAALLAERSIEPEMPPAATPAPRAAGDSVEPQRGGAPDAAEPQRAGGPSPLERERAAALVRTLARAEQPARVDEVARPAPPSAPPPAASRASEPEMDLDQELRLTEEAVAASRRLSAPFEVEGSDPAPHEAPARRAEASLASAHACLSAGHICRSGAECCQGLACAGGVAGYGTPGRCEAPR
jgi:hypothetical protein